MKEIKFESRPKNRVRVSMIERDSAGRIVRKRQFTVSAGEFEFEVRRSGLVPERVVEAPATTEAEQLLLANEIAWYAAQLGRTGGTPTAESIRQTLWDRVNKKLGLS